MVNVHIFDFFCHVINKLGLLNYGGFFFDNLTDLNGSLKQQKTIFDPWTHGKCPCCHG